MVDCATVDGVRRDARILGGLSSPSKWNDGSMDRWGRKGRKKPLEAFRKLVSKMMLI